MSQETALAFSTRQTPAILESETISAIQPQSDTWVPRMQSDSSLGSNAGLNTSAPDILWVIRDLTKNPKAQWRSSAQRALLVETLDMRSDVLAILPTNGGKSMCYIVSTLTEGGYTVAVIPLKSLMADTERKLRTMDVEFLTYQKGAALSEDSKLILVSIEYACTPEWRKALAELDSAGIADVTFCFHRSRLL